MRPWQTIYDERRSSFEESRTVATSRRGGGKEEWKAPRNIVRGWSNVPFDGGRILH